jgi:hypothetical protein
MNLAHQNILGFLSSLFIALEIIKFSSLSEDEEKKSTAEHTETAERFLPKDQKQGSFHEYFILSVFSQISAVWASFFLLGIQRLSFSGSSADEDKKDDRRGSRERRDPSMNTPWEFEVPGSVGIEAAFSLAPWALSLWPILPLRALRPLWLSFF